MSNFSRPSVINTRQSNSARRTNIANIPALKASTSLIAKVAGALLLLAGPQTAIAANDAGTGGAMTEGKAWPAIAKPSVDAPNILLIMTDDVGFSATSTFGGAIPTPNYDRLAKDGARYNGFNTTAICSPTRASLLTGREPHHVEMGNVNNVATGYRGYTSVIPKEAGSIAEALKAAGYATAAFGKWHQTPEWEQTIFGPFDRWPTGSGFDYFYGFIGGDTDQYAPALYRNTTAVAPPTDDPDYILDKDLATDVISYIHRVKEVAPDHPFFVYLAPGTAHSPHSAPTDWIAKFRGKFDMGWDELRKRTFDRQKQAGIIPPNAKLTPRPDFLPAWSNLSAERKKVYARMMEVYAAALAYNDAQVGRILDDLERTGQRDNTLVIFIQGDNGASAEGGPQGLHTEESMINGSTESFQYLQAHLDELGGPKAHNHFPAMWAWALNTPFQYYKQVASHAGGTRNGMVVNWPGHIKDPGKVRQQFLHVSDVMPTILEAAKVPAPEVINGVRQMPLDGISFAYTFTAPGTDGARHTQVFEMMQNLGIYHDGWTAGTRPVAAPWEITTKSLNVDVSKRQWELYDIDKDFSQANNLARTNPEKLKEMKQLFFSEAQKYNILPIHGVYDGAGGRPSLATGRTVFRYLDPVSRIPENGAPKTLGRSFDIAADIVVPESGAQGVLVTQGGRFGGYALYLDKGVPVFHYNATGENQYLIRGDGPIVPGTHKLTASFVIDKPVRGSGGTLTLSLDGHKVGEGRIEKTYKTWFSNSEGFDVGQDTLTPIGDEYSIADSKFTGELKELRVELK
jgi:arylsulfatase